MATQGLQNTRMQYPGSVYDAENAREAEYEEARSVVLSDAIKSFPRPTSALSFAPPVPA